MINIACENDLPVGYCRVFEKTFVPTRVKICQNTPIARSDTFCMTMRATCLIWQNYKFCKRSAELCQVGRISKELR